eukprot:3927951-Pyramimonas_sp.AAC.1
MRVPTRIVRACVLESRAEMAAALLVARGAMPRPPIDLAEVTWGQPRGAWPRCQATPGIVVLLRGCLLYTSDAADDTPCVDL